MKRGMPMRPGNKESKKEVAQNLKVINSTGSRYNLCKTGERFVE